jgi:hypothetical protein
MAQEQQRGLGGPVEVVEDEQDRRLCGDRSQPYRHGIEEAVALGLGIGPQRLGQAADEIGDLGNQPDELTSVATEARCAPLGSGVHDVVAQRLHEGLEGNAEVLVAASGQDDGILGVDQAGELGGEPGLTDPGLTGEERQLPVSGRCSLPQLLQPFELVVPADEDPVCPREQLRDWNARPGSDQRCPVDFADRHRVGQTLQLQRAELGVRGGRPAPGHCPQQGRGQDLTRAGGGHQPGRLHHRRPEDVAGIETDLADRQTDPDGDGIGQTATLPIGCLLHRHCRRDRRHRRRERGQQAVTRVLDLGPALGRDRVPQQLEVGRPHPVEGGVAHPGHELGRPDQVCEQHRRGAAGQTLPGHARNGTTNRTCRRGRRPGPSTLRLRTAGDPARPQPCFRTGPRR